MFKTGLKFIVFDTSLAISLRHPIPAIFRAIASDYECKFISEDDVSNVWKLLRSKEMHMKNKEEYDKKLKGDIRQILDATLESSPHNTIKNEIQARIFQSLTNHRSFYSPTDFIDFIDDLHDRKAAWKVLNANPYLKQIAMKLNKRINHYYFTPRHLVAVDRPVESVLENLIYKPEVSKFLTNDPVNYHLAKDHGIPAMLITRNLPSYQNAEESEETARTLSIAQRKLFPVEMPSFSRSPVSTQPLSDFTSKPLPDFEFGEPELPSSLHKKNVGKKFIPDDSLKSL